MSKAKTVQRVYLGVIHTWLSQTSLRPFLSTGLPRPLLWTLNLTIGWTEATQRSSALSEGTESSTSAGAYSHLSDTLPVDSVFSFSNTESYSRLRQQPWDFPVPELNCFIEWSSCTLSLLQQHLLFPALSTYLRFIVLRSLTPISSPSTAWAPGQQLNLFNQCWAHSSTNSCQITLAAFLSPTVTLCPGSLFFSVLLHWLLSFFLPDGDLKREALSPSSSKHCDAGQVIGTYTVAVCLWHPCQVQEISNSQRLYWCDSIKFSWGCTSLGPWKNQLLFSIWIHP